MPEWERQVGWVITQIDSEPLLRIRRGSVPAVSWLPIYGLDVQCQTSRLFLPSWYIGIYLMLSVKRAQREHESMLWRL